MERVYKKSVNISLRVYYFLIYFTVKVQFCPTRKLEVIKFLN